MTISDSVMIRLTASVDVGGWMTLVQAAGLICSESLCF